MLISESLKKDKIIGCYTRKAESIFNISNSYNDSVKTIYKASVMTMSQLDAVLNNKDLGISEVYIKTELLQEKDIKEALSKVKSSGLCCYIVMPHIFRQYTWDYEEKLVANGTSIYMQQWDGYVIRNFEEYIFLKEVLSIDSRNIITDSGLYVMNSQAAVFWEQLGVIRHTVPFELEISEMKKIAANANMEAVIYTHIPLMVSAQCTVRNINGCQKAYGVDGSHTIIHDSNGREFIIVNYCKYCYNTVYQGEPLSVVKYVNNLSDIRIKSFRYDFTIETAAEIDNILSEKYNGKTHTGHYFNKIK